MLPETPRLIMGLLGDVQDKLILNYGSSTENFYKVDQPFIWNELLEPLKRRNVVLNADIKTGPGIDLHCPILLHDEDPRFDIIMCCSVLEHVVDVRSTIADLRRLIMPDGVLIADVPAVYPCHEDPIDTGLRIYTRWGWEYFLQGFFIVEEFVEVGIQATLVKARPC